MKIFGFLRKQTPIPTETSINRETHGKAKYELVKVFTGTKYNDFVISEELINNIVSDCWKTFYDECKKCIERGEISFCISRYSIPFYTLCGTAVPSHKKMMSMKLFSQGWFKNLKLLVSHFQATENSSLSR